VLRRLSFWQALCPLALARWTCSRLSQICVLLIDAVASLCSSPILAHSPPPPPPLRPPSRYSNDKLILVHILPQGQHDRYLTAKDLLDSFSDPVSQALTC
jgi:hypothetical protein